MFFRISEQAHKQSVLDFVDKQHPINKLALTRKNVLLFIQNGSINKINSLPLSKTCKG